MTITYPDDSSYSLSDWTLLSQRWFPVAVAEDVQTGPVQACLLDVDLVLFRGAGGELLAAHDRCPHRGMMLSRGWVSEGQLVCPYHGLHFDALGRCVLIPSDPKGVITDRLSLVRAACVERYGLIWVSLCGDVPALPAFEAWDDGDYQAIVCPVVDIDGSAGRQVEGFLDVAHFAWAHTTTFGDRTNPVVPEFLVQRTSDGFLAEYVSNVSNYGPAQRHLAPADFIWRRTFQVFPPFSARLIVDFPNDKKLWILNAASPMSARRTRLFCPLARNFDKDGSVDAVQAFNQAVFHEDRTLVEHQRPKDLPLDLSLEAHIAADRSSIAYRRLLKQLGLSLAPVR